MLSMFSNISSVIDRKINENGWFTYSDICFHFFPIWYSWNNLYRILYNTIP